VDLDLSGVLLLVFFLIGGLALWAATDDPHRR
jgi:hypothetical protein